MIATTVTRDTSKNRGPSPRTFRKRFAAGYQPKDATEFVSDLVARLTVCAND
jgi:hypothetical protein